MAIVRTFNFSASATGIIPITAAWTIFLADFSKTTKAWP